MRIRKLTYLASALAVMASIGIPAVLTGDAAAAPETGSASVVPTTTAAAAAAAAIPAPTASISEWQAWSASQRAAIESVPWSQLIGQAGCTFHTASYTPASAALGLEGAPAGITTTVVTLTFHCPQGAQPSFLAAGDDAHGLDTTSAATLSVPRGDPCGTITDGSQCVGTLTYYGTPNYVDASYKFYGTYVYGHDELSNEGALASTCHVGTALATGSNRGFYYGTEQVVIYGPRNFSTVWNGNFWRFYTPGYTNWGNVCGLF